MQTSKYKVSLGSLVLLGLVGCSSSGSSEDTVDSPDISGDPAVPGSDGIPSADTSSVAGIWDASFESEDGRQNTLYIRISDDARLFYIDYQGDGNDAVEGGTLANCYDIEETNIASLGDDRYLIGNTRTQEEVEQNIAAQIELTIVSDNGDLSVTGVDTIDLDRDGNIAEDISTQWVDLTGIDTSFTECVPSVDGSGEEAVVTDTGSGIPSADTSAIAGLWDASYADASGTMNTLYIRVTNDSRWLQIEYQGDANDSGNGTLADCYITRETNVISMGGDEYQIGNIMTAQEADVSAPSSGVFTIVSNGEELIISGNDVIDIDNDGNSAEDVSVQWSSASEPSFTSCE